MKTFNLIFLGLFLFGLSAQAQKIYIRGGLGVAASTAADYVTNGSVNSSGSSISTSKKQGIGTGLPFVLAAGYNINKNFGFELGVDYFYGFFNKQSWSGNSYSYGSKSRGQMLSIVPAFVMSLPFAKFKPYARIGLKLGVWNSMVIKPHDEYQINNVVEATIKDYGGLAVGVQTAIGTDFILSKHMSLFGEIQVDGISWAPTHGKYTEYIENGVDKLASRTVNQNEWNFVKEVDNTNLPDDQPRQVNKVNQPFGNVGLVFGVKVNL